jgi:phosphoglycolate phosphatase/AHBA synthesis associated protein
MVGDSRFDREAARAAGVRFVGFRTAGDRTVRTLGELPALLEELP